MRLLRRRSSNERGASLVEFALIAPLLFALLLGTFTGAIALSQQNSMTNANREGARLGATLPPDSDWPDSVRGRVVGLSGGDLTTDDVCVRLVYKASETDTSGTTVRASSCDTALASGEPSLPAGAAENDCLVKVWSRRTAQLEAIFFAQSLTLTAHAVARYERGGGASCTT